MGYKTKAFLQELFLILASIIGMGFASGKEILHFFCYNKLLAGISILIFVILFFFFFGAIKNYQLKHNIKNFNELNSNLFKDSSKYVNYILIIIYTICASSMLAGVDILSRDVLGVKLPFFSVMLTICLYFILIGGVGRIKNLFLKVVPILLILVVLNLSVNSWEVVSNKLISSESLPTSLTIKDIAFSLLLPIVFWGGNTILAINSILQLRTNHRAIKWVSSFIFLFLMLLGAMVIVGLNLNSSMPFLNASSNLSHVFYSLYLVGIIVALFSSLVISTHNINIVLNIKNRFGIILVLSINQAIAFLGFDFIVSYLYTFSGILGLIYCFVLWFKIKKTNKTNIKNKKQN